MKLGLVLVAALAIAACTKTYEAGGTTDTTADTTVRISVPDIELGVKTDTFTVPTIKTGNDSIIVTKKQVEVKRPTVDVKRKP